MKKTRLNCPYEPFKFHSFGFPVCPSTRLCLSNPRGRARWLPTKGRGSPDITLSCLMSNLDLGFFRRRGEKKDAFWIPKEKKNKTLQTLKLHCWTLVMCVSPKKRFLPSRQGGVDRQGGGGTGVALPLKRGWPPAAQPLPPDTHGRGLTSCHNNTATENPRVSRRDDRRCWRILVSQAVLHSTADREGPVHCGALLLSLIGQGVLSSRRRYTPPPLSVLLFFCCCCFGFVFCFFCLVVVVFFIDLLE